MLTSYTPRPGIYVHIPFCVSKCHYCDFNSYALGQAKTEPYVRALVREIEEATPVIPPEGGFESVFFGGGTPTTCSPEQLARVLDTVRYRYPLAPDAEITTEANPGTVTAPQLAALREAGFNRISFGVQAFDDALLRSVGRIHTGAEAVEAVEMARAAGFDNVNADLMFGLPGQTLAAFRETLRRAFDLDTPHLSIYGLLVEEGTAFGRWREEGRLHLPDDTLERAMLEAAMEEAVAYGYERYEVSNYARPGFACRHNPVYWRNDPYLGFGAGAVSYWDGVRATRCQLPGDYVRRVREGRSLIVEEEALPAEAALGESLMLGLRMIEGVDMDTLTERFGLDPRRRFASHMERMSVAGLLYSDGPRLHLTHEGLFLANEVWAGFI